MGKRITRLLLAAALAFGAGACSSDKSSSTTAGVTSWCDLPQSCREITQACMPKDDGTPGQVHDCHMTGMEKGIEADCARVLSTCVAACNAAPSLTDGQVDDLFALCGIDAAVGDLTFPEQPLSTFQSDGGDLNIELRTAPYQPMHVGPGSAGQVRITDTNGTPVDGLTFKAECWMPIMGHNCSGVGTDVEPKGGGVYVLTPLLVAMKGAIQVQLTFTGSKSERALSTIIQITE